MKKILRHQTIFILISNRDIPIQSIMTLAHRIPFGKYRKDSWPKVLILETIDYVNESGSNCFSSKESRMNSKSGYLLATFIFLVLMIEDAYTEKRRKKRFTRISFPKGSTLSVRKKSLIYSIIRMNFSLLTQNISYNAFQ